MSEPSNEIAAALAKAQAEMNNPAFDSQNPHFKSKFASLASVRNAVIPVLAKHGIACVQNITTEGESLRCTTMLLHSSGQGLQFGPLTLPTARADAQGFGSAATYARRYALMAVAGVVGDDDDDGNAAVKTNGHANGNGKITEMQKLELIRALAEVSAPLEGFLKWAKVSKLEEIQVDNYATCVEAIRARGKK